MPKSVYSAAAGLHKLSMQVSLKQVPFMQVPFVLVPWTSGTETDWLTIEMQPTMSRYTTIKYASIINERASKRLASH
jgi:hypothetical protein